MKPLYYESWLDESPNVPPRDQNQLTEHTSLPELFRFGFASQLFDCISNATCFLSSTRLVLFHHTLNNSLSQVCGTIGTNGTIVLYEKLFMGALCKVANQVTGRRACFNIIIHRYQQKYKQRVLSIKYIL